MVNMAQIYTPDTAQSASKEMAAVLAQAPGERMLFKVAMQLIDSTLQS